MNTDSKLSITERSELLRFGRWFCSWRTLRAMFLILAWPLTLIALFYGIENWRGRHAWNQCRQELESKGAVLEWAATVPRQIREDADNAPASLMKIWLEKIRNDKSRNGVFSLARSRVQHMSQFRANNRQRIPTDIVAWQMAYAAATGPDSNKLDKEYSFPNSDATARANAGRELLQHLETFEPLFNALRQVSSHPESRWPVNYSGPLKVDLAHHFDIAAAGEQLGLKASAELAAGRTDKAQEDIRLLLALGDSLRKEPVLLSQMLGGGPLSRGLQSLWEGIVLHQWSALQLERFQGLLTNYNLFEGIPRWVQTERASALAILDLIHAKRDPGLLRGFTASEAEDPWPGVLAKFGPSGWYDFEKVNYCRLYELTSTTGWDAKAMRVWPKEVDETRDRVAKAIYTNSFKRLFAHQMVVGSFPIGWSRVIETAATQQTYVNQAVIACALERYLLSNGGYPESLEALEGTGLIGALPQDVFTGHPMMYKRVADNEYMLYSVGWNGRDDGGEPGETTFDRAAGDWVW